MIKFKRGDIVTRIADDLHLVIGVNESGDLIHTRCIKPDSGGCFKAGDDEWACAVSYDFVCDDISKLRIPHYLQQNKSTK